MYRPALAPSGAGFKQSTEVPSPVPCFGVLWGSADANQRLVTGPRCCWGLHRGCTGPHLSSISVPLMMHSIVNEVCGLVRVGASSQASGDTFAFLALDSHVRDKIHAAGRDKQGTTYYCLVRSNYWCWPALVLHGSGCSPQVPPTNTCRQANMNQTFLHIVILTSICCSHIDESSSINLHVPATTTNHTNHSSTPTPHQLKTMSSESESARPPLTSAPVCPSALTPLR